MKIEIYHDMEMLKRILCYTSSPQAIAVTEDMVDHLCLGSTEVTLISTSGQNFIELLNDLSLESKFKGNHHRVIMSIRTPVYYSLPLSELSYITNLIDQFSTETEICWGMATSTNQENNITLLIAISSK